MSNEKSYNGWHNYETWNVKLWLDNDQGTQELQREWAEQARKPTGTLPREPAGVLADMIKDYVEECAPDLGASMYADLLGAAISEVDFYEIAEAILEDSPPPVVFEGSEAELDDNA